MTDLTDLARSILRQNDKGGYTLPTHGLYPYQWNWDSAFAAWGFSTFDAGRAWEELETLVSGQWEDGMIPHILFHRPDPGYFPGSDVWQGRGPIPSSGISQPPVAASFMAKILANDPTGEPRARALWPKLRDWHHWFMKWRLDQGAVCVTHPWEAGRDNAPDWDAAMRAIDPSGVGEYTRRDTSHVDPAMRPTKYDYDRYIKLVQIGVSVNWDQAKLLELNPFRVADPTMTFTLLRAQRDLAAMGRRFGEDVSMIEEWISTLEAGAATLWNDETGGYDSRDAHTGRFNGVLSNASALCWYAGINDQRARPAIERMLGACEYGLPSYDPQAEGFESLRYWRGPTWPIMNYLVGSGLEEQGQHDLAGRIRRDTARLMEMNGFAEYYDPLSGAPAGGGSFTWTAAVWLGWAGLSPETRQGAA
ncbi:MGH1-like glycoside hydrolase domain-containing protein [Roseobacter sp. S98]|uniref:MGH1-like glycoside hydrolase domain-containing protein n=1 Tax=Roseobacter algicola (ex Choi et al. 2025) (nom. illeg.) TaxID=3092138 RepID=UPI003F51637D